MIRYGNLWNVILNDGIRLRSAAGPVMDPEHAEGEAPEQPQP